MDSPAFSPVSMLGRSDGGAGNEGRPKAAAEDADAEIAKWMKRCKAETDQADVQAVQEKLQEKIASSLREELKELDATAWMYEKS
mmetsp:Transcript_1208/g.2749  ORF Transcript_1208/g.2749 Transcript_1208/m.2749 type:complete len:85 (+) Transcript_1208:192-446(+)